MFGGEGFVPCGLLGIIFCSEGHVMDHACAHCSMARIGDAEEIDGGGKPFARAGVIAVAIFFVSTGFEAHDVGQELGCVFVSLFGDGDAVEATNRIFCGDRAGGPGLAHWIGGGDDFERQCVGISEAKDALAEAVGGL